MAQAQAQFELGLQEYQAKDYAKAAQHFESAYSLDHDPIYEFNEAQAFRQLGDCRRAVALYTQFRDDASKSLSAQDLDKVKRYINGEGCTQATPPTPPQPPPNNPPPNNPPPKPIRRPTSSRRWSPRIRSDTWLVPCGAIRDALAYGIGVAAGSSAAMRGTARTSRTKTSDDAATTLRDCNGSNAEHVHDSPQRCKAAQAHAIGVISDTFRRTRPRLRPVGGGRARRPAAR